MELFVDNSLRNYTITRPKVDRNANEHTARVNLNSKTENEKLSSDLTRFKI